MKAIKCPNCGKRMMWSCDLNKYTADEERVHYVCSQCGVAGPAGDAPTINGAIRAAARLTREWIARMNRDKANAYQGGYDAGWHKGYATGEGKTP